MGQRRNRCAITLPLSFARGRNKNEIIPVLREKLSIQKVEETNHGTDFQKDSLPTQFSLFS